MLDSDVTQPGQPNAAPRTLLVGTSRSVEHLCHLLKLADPPPQIVGCLVPAPAVDAADPPVPILGDLEAIESILERQGVDQVLVSLPAAMRPQIQQLASILQPRPITWRLLPTLTDQLAGRTRFVYAAADDEAPQAAGPVSTNGSPLDALDPLHLLNRRPAPLDREAIAGVLADRVVLITGAGGSIGSELARLVAGFAPRKLVLVDRSENALFEIDRQIASRFPDLRRATVLHDVTDAAGTSTIVSSHRPKVVFHAAAHKHVPMMEDHPAQAVENNFYGTRSIADAAARTGAERFVMISSDKAVNPSSVMGATKRLAELYVQYLNAQSETRFCMVRFGNVLGSACSVLPIWSRQLVEGGPVTVTHPDMHRYFMTIPEAAGLVLQSAAVTGELGLDVDTPAAETRRGGEIFLLDMGEPIRILDLARRFIRAHGLEPDVDVRIEFTGVRPGEKLFEELAYDGEDMIPTPHDSIRIWRTTPPDGQRMSSIIATFDRLRARSGRQGTNWQFANRDAIVTALRASVPEMVAAAAAG